MSWKGTYDGTIHYNPVDKFTIIIVKTPDQNVPREARQERRYPDHLIRFTAIGYELPRTDAVELEMDGEWVDGKHGFQLQVEHWKEIIPRSEEGVKGYLSSGLIKGIGPKLADDLVMRFGVNVLDILEKQPERLLEIKGITENRLEEIKTSYAESRMLRDLMTLLSPFKVTPKTALKIYQELGPTSVEMLKKSPYELCGISGFGFLRVDAIVRKTDNRPHDPMRMKGALLCALNNARSEKGHLFLEKEVLLKETLRLLNKTIPLPDQRLSMQEVADVLQELVLCGTVVLVKAKMCKQERDLKTGRLIQKIDMEDLIYRPNVFEQEDETARQIALRLTERQPQEQISSLLEKLKVQVNLMLSEKQEMGVKQAFQSSLSIITGPPGTGKTTVIKMIIELFRVLYPKSGIMLMAPTGRASRRMAESTGFEEARTMHNALRLSSEEAESHHSKEEDLLSAGLIIVDEFSLVDMWLAKLFFTRLKKGTKIVLVGDVDQLPSVGAGNVLREMIQCGLVPVTVLDEIFRQAKDSFIPYNGKLINQGDTNLFYGNDFVFIPSAGQTETSEKLVEMYCQEIAENGVERVQILSPFRAEGETSVNRLNAVIREIVNPFCSTEDEINAGIKTFRIGDRIMQTKNTEHVSNGDLGFIRSIEDTPNGKKVSVEFGKGKKFEYGPEELNQLELAYATTVHKAMGSETDIILMPILGAHRIMLYRNLLYTGVTRAKKKVILIGEKTALFMAIRKSNNSKRNTLLGQRIRLYYRAFARRNGILLPAELEEELKNAG